MSRLIFDRKEKRPLLYLDDYDWTNDRLKDEMFLSLVKAPRGKYYRQAKDLMFRIPLTEQYPKSEKETVAFIVSFNELSSRVQTEFIECCKIFPPRYVTILLKEVVIRLFENLDYDYAHMSVMKKLRVKVQR